MSQLLREILLLPEGCDVQVAVLLNLLRRLCTDALCRHVPVDSAALFLQGLHEARVLLFTPQLVVERLVLPRKATCLVQHGAFGAAAHVTGPPCSYCP